MRDIASIIHMLSMGITSMVSGGFTSPLSNAQLTVFIRSPYEIAFDSGRGQS